MEAALRQATAYGKYVLLERVSVGGMAEIFKAKAFGVEGFEKILAIKRILPSMAEDADFIEMFIDEAKICGQLNHANICQIYELGRVADSHFIAMEYVWGKDTLQIQNRFRKLRQKMRPEMAAYIACKICEGLDYAHKKKDASGRPLGIIHRDISPQNILISYEGELKVIDFGIAKAASRSSKTQAGVLKGKFGYMSPEQVRGLPLDRRSDIFAIGTILYELLTTERLFYGESDFETLEKVRNVDVPPPSAVNPQVPKSLEKIIMRALSKDVEGRYQWASEMAEDLNAFLLTQEPVFTAVHLAQWMREQFSVEMRRERLVLDEQQKVTRDMVQPAPSPAAASRPPRTSGVRMAVAPPPAALVDDSVDEDEDEEEFNEKTTVTSPGFDAVVDPELADQSTRILDGGGPPQPLRVRSADLAGQETVVFSESGQARLPPSPLDAQPLAGHSEPSLVYPPRPVEAPFTPRNGQVGSLPPPPRSSVWKDVLIGVAVAAAVVGGVLGARAYLGNRAQGALVVVSAGASGELSLDGQPKGRLSPGAPVTLKGLPFGEHHVLVRGDTGEWKQTVTVAAGDVNVLTVSFGEPPLAMGKLKLEIEAQLPSGGFGPSTADIYVDGAQISGEAASAPLSLRANASHEIRVQRPGFVDQRFNIDLKAGETLVRPVQLVAVDPPAAEAKPEPDKSVTPKEEGVADSAEHARPVEHVEHARPGKTPRETRTQTKDPAKEAVAAKDPPTTKDVPVKHLPSEGLAAVSFGGDKDRAQDSGYLVANTQPWAKVFIDGKDTGKTTPIAPRSKIPLRPGKHTVTFVVSGKKYNYDVTVKPGEELRLIKQLSDGP